MADILNVGDVVYTTQYSTTVTEYIIERVTPTTAISGNRIFIRDANGHGNFRIKGASKFDPSFATRETEDVRRRKGNNELKRLEGEIKALLSCNFSSGKNTQDCEVKTEKLKQVLLLLSE